MNKTIFIALLGFLLTSCDLNKKERIEKTPSKITEEFLSGKEFIADKKQIMGSKHFVFIDENKFSYYIRDKTAYGYDGTYAFEYDDKGKQFIKMTEKEGKLIVVLSVKSPIELEIKKVEPEIYKSTKSDSFDIRHSIGKIYQIDSMEIERN